MLAAAGTAAGAAVLVTVLRTWLMPLLRDVDTGLFSANIPAIAATLAALLALFLLGRRMGRRRIDIGGKRAMTLSLAAIFAGAVIGVCGLWDIYSLLTGGVSSSVTQSMARIAAVTKFLCVLFSLIGAVSLVRFGLQVASEDGTRIGMSTWPLLAPVLWVWFRLVWYEMSYVSAVRLNESYFDYMMLIFEILFFFKLARFASGIGTTRPGMLMFFAGGAAVFSLSAPLTRALLYLRQDPEAYLAREMAGVPDLAVGALALAFAFALAGSVLPACTEEDPADAPADAPSAAEPPAEPQD